jgi:hypothetical protein
LSSSVTLLGRIASVSLDGLSSESLNRSIDAEGFGFRPCSNSSRISPRYKI